MGLGGQEGESQQPADKCDCLECFYKGGNRNMTAPSYSNLVYRKGGLASYGRKSEPDFLLFEKGSSN